MPTAGELRAMMEADVRTADKSLLADISGMEIDMTLPRKERVRDYIQKAKNPYCYIDNGIVVKLSFSNNGRTLTDCLCSLLGSVDYPQ